MAVTLEKFVQQLEDSGIIAGDTLKDFLPPKSKPRDAEELARELVRQRKLTKFQAEVISKGKADSLTLGNYVLMEKIGGGGMGQVFKARHRVMERFVAVKVLPAAMTKDKTAIARFHREVKAAAKLRHINIVAADDADQANGVHFLVMELVEGSDLSALVKKYGPLSVNQAVNYILQAAKGLETAHAEGIVHRDIKPANLLLDKKGTVKILDMGLARLCGDGDGPPQADLTNTGTFMGTVDFMAPEQAEDAKTADARADIYALGCSLFYLLTGRAIYEGETLIKKVLAHRDKPIPSLRSVRPDVPGQLEAVFETMLAKKVEDRYQSMTTVIADLERCSAGNETTAILPAPDVPATDADLTQFLNEIAATPKKALRTKKGIKPQLTVSKKKLLLIGSGLFGIAMLVVIFVWLKTKDGTQRLKAEKDGITVFEQSDKKLSDKTELNTKQVPVRDEAADVAATPTTIADKTQKRLAYLTPGFEKWKTNVAAMSAEKQVEAVVEKLQELNPGFDPHVMHTIEKKVVTKFEFHTNNVTDISPVRALVGLKRLVCLEGDVNSRALSDLSPLDGMNLTTIELNPKRITKGMEIIRQMKSLKTIGIGPETIVVGLDGNGRLFSPDEFWKMYDSGVFGTPTSQPR